jgi:histidinol-phosphate aminotransferase
MKVKIIPQRGLETLPAYRPGRNIEEIQREYGITDVIKLASNENPLGVSPKAVEAMENIIRKVNLYPDGQSYSLRNSLAKHLHVKPEQVMVGNGEDGLILEICLSFLDETSEAIVSCSSFPIYDIYIRTMRANLIKTPLHEFRLDLQAMADAVTKRTKLVFVCNPNNPTGTTISAVDVEAFLLRIPDNVLVIFDEAYFEFVDTKNFPDTIKYIQEGRENILVLRTFSKIYGLAGLRLGYAIGAASTLSAINKVKEPFSVNLLAQIAGLAALEDQDFRQKTLELTLEGRSYLYQEFDRLDINYVKSQTNFILTEIGPHANEVIEKMTCKGVIVRPCSAYDLPNFARVSIGTPEQNARLVKTLEEVLNAGY